MTDVDLLDQYAAGSEDAFVELLRRHLNWVYTAARRKVRDAHLAEDVTQAVFIVLSRRPAAARGASLAGWLFRVLDYTAARAVRGESRRRRREMTAVAETPTRGVDDVATNVEWRELAPLLDALVAKLDAADREAVLLRFYRQMTYAEVGQALGTTGEAARKRVDRALVELRRLASGRGLAIPAAAMGTAITQAAAPAAVPAGLAAVTTTAALGNAAAAISSGPAALAEQTLFVLATAKAKLAAMVMIGLIALVVAGAAGHRWLAAGAAAVPASQSAAPQTSPAVPRMAAGAPATAPSSASRPSDYLTPYGPNLFRTTASQQVLGAVIQQAADQLAETIDNGDGSISMPSYHGSGQSWKDEKGQPLSARDSVEFIDKAGKLNRIQTIKIPGEPALVILEAPDTTLFNTISQALHAHAARDTQARLRTLQRAIEGPFRAVDAAVKQGDAVAIRAATPALVSAFDVFVKATAGTAVEASAKAASSVARQLAAAADGDDVAASRRLLGDFLTANRGIGREIKDMVRIENGRPTTSPAAGARW